MNYDPTMREKILSFIRANGPILPVQISKQFGGNLIFSGAILSELVSRRSVMISTAKVGGSPVYYVEGQERKLDVLYSHLRDVHKNVFDLLKENKILKDSELDAWQRVALRELKDFAYPIQREDGIFWRWYLINEEEAMRMIDERFSITQPAEDEIKIEENKIEKIQENIVQEPVRLPEQPQIIEKQAEQKPQKKPRIKKDIGLNITNYFSSKMATVLEEKIIRKNSDMEYIIEIPSNVGKIKFFVKVKNKKVINDADLVLAHNDAQLKKLPLLFLSNGEVNKKGEEYASKNFLVFEKI